MVKEEPIADGPGGRLVDLGEVELFVREAGSGPPLLLIHGSGPDSRGWDPTFEMLAETHRVIAYDRRGYGASGEAALGGGWAAHGDDAIALLRALDVPSATVVGWSAGGYPALHIAAEAPELVDSVVLAETGIPLPPTATASYALLYARMHLLRRLGRERQALEGFYRWAGAENGGRNTWDRPDYSQERRERGLANARGVWADFNPRGRPDLSEQRLSRIDRRVTLLIGDQGQPWFRKSAEAFERMLPNARIETIEGTNHFLTYHAPERFADAIAAAAGGTRRGQANEE